MSRYIDGDRSFGMAKTPAECWAIARKEQRALLNIEQPIEGADIPFTFMLAEPRGLSDLPAESRVIFESEAEDCHFGGGASIIAQHRIYTDDLPRKGDRLDEYRFLDLSMTTEKMWRPGPWMVTHVEVYPASPGDANRSLRLIICACSFAPLPEAQNPWQPLRVFQLAEAAV